MNAIKRTLLWGASAVLTFNCLGCNLLAIPTPVSWTLTRTPSSTPETPTSTLPNATLIPRGRTQAPPNPGTTPRPTDQSAWLVYSHADGKTLVALDPYASAAAQPVTIALPDPLLMAGDLQAGASPTGGWLAVRTGSAGPTAGAAPRQNMALRLVHLPDGSVTEISPLLSPELEKQLDAAGAGSAPLQAAIAVAEEDALSWSPNGRYLAYIAAANGPSSDLYVYDLQTRQSTRLTKGSRQAATPVWSPDSRWIVTQEVASFGGGPGWQATAVWAAAVDQSEIRRLYTPPEAGGGERFLGWTAPDSLVVATWTPAGIQNVRELPLSVRWVNSIYAGPVDTIAFDPTTRWFYFTTHGGGKPSIPTPVESTAPPTAMAPQPQPQVPGLYQISASGGPPGLVLAGEWRQVTWRSRAGLFIASGAQGVLLVKPNGSANLIKDEGNGLPSPNGLWIAGWADAAPASPTASGVNLYQPDGTLLQEVSNQPVQRLFWAPDSSGIYFQSGATLYRSGFPNPEAQTVDANVLPLGVALVPAAK